jgi:hypothetical protein
LSHRDQFLASAFRDLDAHGIKEPRRDVVTVIAKECERGRLREGRCGSVCVKTRIEQRLGNEVISEPIVGDEDNFLVRWVLVPYRLFNQYAFDNQPAIQRTLAFRSLARNHAEAIYCQNTLNSSIVARTPQALHASC